MGDVVDHVDAGDVLLLQVVNRLAFPLAEDGDQHVAARDFLAARGLSMENRALQDALEAQGGLSLPLGVTRRNQRRGGLDVLA